MEVHDSPKVRITNVKDMHASDEVLHGKQTTGL